MIVLEDQQQSKDSTSVAGPTNRASEPYSRNSIFSLPDYETSVSQASFSPLKKTEIHLSFIATLRSDRRFWRAVCCAFLIYLVISVAVGVPLIIMASRKRASAWNLLYTLESFPGSAPDTHIKLSELASLPAVSDSYCNLWETWDIRNNLDSLLSANVQQIFPLGTSITIRSNYSNTSQSLNTTFGTLDILLNPNPSEVNGILNLTMSYSNFRLGNDTAVCILTGEEVELSIFIPSDFSSQDTLTFNITLLLPQTSSIITLPSLSTDLPFFAHRFGNLGQYFSFEQVSVQGPGSMVVVDSIRGGTISIRTSMAEIVGVFNVSGSLTLDTMSAPINADVILVDDPRGEDHPVLNICTGNSDIHANVTLLAVENSDKAKFLMTTKTFNGQLNVAISHAASLRPSIYGLRVYNNMGATQVTVDSKYEGTFDVGTKFASAVVNNGTNPNNLINPYGTNQPRQYEYDFMSTWRVIGWTGWSSRKITTEDHDETLQGYIVVKSSLSPVSLQLSEGG